VDHAVDTGLLDQPDQPAAEGEEHGEAERHQREGEAAERGL
jgi:hypothetical protein